MFMRSLNRSKSKEIRILSGCVQGDVKSTTGGNVAYITREIDTNILEGGGGTKDGGWTY